ncbi:hypothetical protein [Pedobacter polysacchareus]|uniref:hypothetical protein n=1 Tax=Pedobacter polysacchareus TaxID=2861973 RepID=UPI001C9A220D|nr:hypothetical protein [Pedobacter polysacchareus]
MLGFEKVIRTDADMLQLLSGMEDLNFNSIRFKINIDFCSLIGSNQIEGVVVINDDEGVPLNKSLRKVNPSFDISGLKFSIPLSFVDCVFEIPLKVKSSIFEEGIIIRLTEFEKGFEFFDVVAEGVSTFGFSSKKSVLFMRCILSTLDLNYPKIKIDNNFFILESSINSGLDLTKCIVKNQLQLSGEIDGILDLSMGEIGSLHIGSSKVNSKCTEINGLNLSELKISGQLQLNNVLINGTVNATGINFEESIFWEDVEFRGKVFFQHCSFMKSIESKNVIVRKLIDFYGSHFNSEMRFIEMDLHEADIILTATHINSDLWIGALYYKDPVSFKGKINLEGAMVSNNSIVRIFNLNSKEKPLGIIEFSNGLIRGLLDIRNIYVTTITLDGTVVTGNIQDNNTLHYSIRDRNSARLLKHEAKKINNLISAGSYYKREMDLYSKSITYKQYTDWFILLMSKWSSDYGANWVRALLFTVIGGMLFYIPFFFLKEGYDFSIKEHSVFLLFDRYFWSGFINYFWLPTGFNELTKNGNDLVGGGFGAAFFIIGKILIAFGIYQTIAAFRKFL